MQLPGNAAPPCSGRALGASQLRPAMIVDQRIEQRRQPGIADLAEMQPIRRYFRRQHSLCIEQRAADIGIEHGPAVGAAGNQPVDGDYLAPQLGIGRGAARQQPQQQDRRLGQPLPQIQQVGADAFGGQFGRARRAVIGQIVGADQQNHQGRRRAVEIAVPQPPQQVFGPVAADPGIEDAARLHVLAPDTRRVVRKALGQQIAEKQHAVRRGPDLLVDRREPLRGPRGDARRRPGKRFRCKGGAGQRRLCGRGRVSARQRQDATEDCGCDPARHSPSGDGQRSGDSAIAATTSRRLGA